MLDLCVSFSVIFIITSSKMWLKCCKVQTFWVKLHSLQWTLQLHAFSFRIYFHFVWVETFLYPTPEINRGKYGILLRLFVGVWHCSQLKPQFVIHAEAAVFLSSAHVSASAVLRDARMHTYWSDTDAQSNQSQTRQYDQHDQLNPRRLWSCSI